MSKGNRNRTNKMMNNPNITVNVEIDYDKLAEAIAKAQNRNDTNKEEVPAGEKIFFWKKCWALLRGKLDTKGEMLSGSMALLVSYLYGALALGCLIISFLYIVYICSDFAELHWNGLNAIITNVLTLSLEILFVCFLLIIGLWAKGAANDIIHEKDKAYVATVFGGVVSFVALLTAIIALILQIKQ